MRSVLPTRVRIAIAAVAATVGLLAGGAATAEPYLAVLTGLKCGGCHLNPTGGGKRNAVGEAYARAELAQRTLERGEGGPIGDVNRWLGIGGDLRADVHSVDTPGAERTSELGVSSAKLYAAVSPVPNLVTLYVDEQVAPGAAAAREAYALITPAAGKYTLKAGKFFLPFGWRLQDDSAFIRQVPGINFSTPDSGIEAGLELPRWSSQIALTNGTAGGPESDAGKQLSVQSSYVRPHFRLGAAVNVNNAALGDRELVSLFAGLRTGPVAWLAEVDSIKDDLAVGDLEQRAALLEADWRFRKGHNLKITAEVHDPSDAIGGDDRYRYSVVWEHSPVQFVQARVGLRSYDGLPTDAASNRDEVFAELHAFF